MRARALPVRSSQPSRFLNNQSMPVPPDSVLAAHSADQDVPVIPERGPSPRFSSYSLPCEASRVLPCGSEEGKRLCVANLGQWVKRDPISPSLVRRQVSPWWQSSKLDRGVGRRERGRRKAHKMKEKRPQVLPQRQEMRIPRVGSAIEDQMSLAWCACALQTELAQQHRRAV